MQLLTLPTPAHRPRLSTVLWHVACPFFLFSLVLFGLLSLSWLLLLPRYTRISVGGTLRSATEIREYRESLTAQIVVKEEDRRQMVLAVHDPQYDAIKEHRQSRPSLDELRAALASQAKAVTGKEDAVVFRTFDYDSAKKALVLRGDVRNVGTRSMTLLAEYAQALKELPFVASATTPSFTRQEDATTGLHSPFVITLTLQ